MNKIDTMSVLVCYFPFQNITSQFSLETNLGMWASNVICTVIQETTKLIVPLDIGSNRIEMRHYV